MRSYSERLGHWFGFLFQTGKLAKVKLDILEPTRKDLQIDGKVGKVIVFNYRDSQPMWFRCFEEDLDYVVGLVENCALFNSDKWQFVFRKNDSYEELKRRKLVTEDNNQIWLGLGIGMTTGGIDEILF